MSDPMVSAPKSSSRAEPKPRVKLFNSKTLAQLTLLLSFLPRQRIRGLVQLLAVSLLVGFSELVFIGLLARLVGAMSGSRLQDKIPAIFFFGGGRADQGLWIAGLLIFLVWFTMGLKYLASLIQSLLSAQIWADYGEKIYSNVLLQPYEYFQSQNTAHMMARLNRIFSRISDDIILPILTIVSSGLTIVVLTVGVVVAFGWQALLIFGFLFGAYTVSSWLVAPPLRFATKQKLLF